LIFENKRLNILLTVITRSVEKRLAINITLYVKRE
jgi:hypothetical protein